MKEYNKPKIVVEKLFTYEESCAISSAGKNVTFANDGKGNYEDFSEFTN